MKTKVGLEYVYGPWAVALGVYMSFTSFSSCFYHISVSGQYCPIDRRVLEK